MALEKKWVTRNPWFCIFTTVVGIHVIDSLMMYIKLCESNKEMTTMSFIDNLSFQLLGKHTSTTNKVSMPSEVIYLSPPGSPVLKIAQDLHDHKVELLPMSYTCRANGTT